MRSVPVFDPVALLFWWLALMQVGRLYSEEPRKKRQLITPLSTQLSKTVMFPLAPETRLVSWKPMRRWRKIWTERLSDSLKHISLTVGGGTPMKGVLLSNKSFSPISAPSLSLCLHLFLFVFLSAFISFYVNTFQIHFYFNFFWISSCAADSSAHRWCGHLLWDSCRRQRAQPLPEGQGAAGDKAP